MKRFLFIVLSATLLLAGCSTSGGGNGVQPSGPDGGEIDAQPIAYVAELKQQPIIALNKSFADGINSFGLEVAKKLYTADKNLALSPVSMELALSMTHAGAGGETAEDMKKALGLKGLSDDEINSACRSLMWRANTGGMEAANSIWLYEGYPFLQSFIDTCMNDFMADAMPLTIPGAMDDINGWASDKTHGRIDEIIPEELDASTLLVLVNALYFLGDWELPFDGNDTNDGEFTTPSGPVTVPFMSSERSVPYYENDGFSMISLDFKSEEGAGEYAMAFLLPAGGKSIGDMLSSLGTQSFSSVLAGMEDQQTRIMLPKFEFTFGVKLNDTLKALGMEKAFDPAQADFSGMTGQRDLYIARVLHKCYLRIDELGAEAAGVTSVEMQRNAIMPTDMNEFIANRPFAFAIYSKEDSTIAFLGAVNDPAAGDS